ncbi:MAG: SLC13 family permease [Candidatus Hydrothermarchaeota archaeon]
MLLALGIFLLTYLLISVQRFPGVSIDRPGGALLGAVLMVLLGVVTFEGAIASIDFRTIVLLLGMMILVSYLAMAGFLDLVSVRILRVARTPFQLLALVAVSAGALSALFVNDTICLIYTPILLRAVLLAKLPPAPYLIALATSSNIGSVATLVGNPQNMLLGMRSGVPFLEFSRRMLPIAVLGLAIDIGVIAYLYRGAIFARGYRVEIPDPKVDVPLLMKALIVLGAVLLGFVLGGNIPLVAISAASAMLLVGGKMPARVLRRVDWTLLLFFSGLFIVMAGVEESGLLEELLALFDPLLRLQGLGFILGLSLLAVVASNIVSNVPFVMMVLPMVDRIGGGDLVFYTLAMSATFAGNLTVIGSVANMIVLELGRRAGVEVGFFEFARVGILVTAATVLVGGVILSLP